MDDQRRSRPELLDLAYRRYRALHRRRVAARAVAAVAACSLVVVGLASADLGNLARRRIVTAGGEEVTPQATPTDIVSPTPEPSPTPESTPSAAPKRSVPRPGDEPAKPPELSRPTLLAVGTGMTEFALPAGVSSPTGLTKGPDGAIWFTAADSDAIGRVASDGTITMFPLPPMPEQSLPSPVGGPSRRSPWDIKTGSDGALWFTERTGNSIGRMTTDGRVTEFPVTSGGNGMGLGGYGAAPAGIIAGPDGALWFTEALGDRIGRITTDGELTEFPLPNRESAHDNPEGITVGPDGALWFVASLGQRVWRLDPKTKAFRSFALPTRAGDGAGVVVLTSITVGADRALWFADRGAIARMTTAGEWTHYPMEGVNTPGGEDIIALPDRTIWFTEGRTNRIGRIGPDGSVTEIPLPSPNSGLSHLTLGSDGAVWFTERQGNRIGRIQLP